MTLILDLACQDNAASTTVDDASASNNDFAAQRNTSLMSQANGPGGSLPRALNFNGVDDFLLGSSTSLTNSDFTIQWFGRRSNTTTAHTVVADLIGTSTVVLEWLTSSHDLQITLGSGLSSTITTSGSTAMHHWAITYSASTGDLTLYKDATSVGTFGTQLANDDISFDSIGTFDAYDGPIAGVRFYDTVRTQPQIQTDYEIGVPSGTAPTITSNGGGSTASISVGENSTAVTSVQAIGDAPITYSISGGTDQAKFSIDSSSGALSFASAPDYESPTDSNTDNAYLVSVTATNASGSDSQDLTVTVTNVVIPTISVAPTLQGFQRVGNEVGSTTGTWNNTPTSYSYQWYRANDNSGSGEASIGGATSSTYTVTSSDIGKYLACKVTATNSEGSSSASSTGYFNGRCVDSASAPATGPVYGSLTALTAFDQKFLLNEVSSDTEPMPSPLSWKDESPQDLVDWSFAAVAAETRTSVNCGALISESFVVSGEHASPSTLYFLQQDGTEISRTVAEHWTINNDFRISRLNAAVTTIAPIGIFADSRVMAGKDFLAIEQDRHLNRLTASNLLNNTADQISFVANDDEIEGGDSGKPSVALVGYTPVLVNAGMHYPTTGPNPSHYQTEISSVLAAFSEAPTIVGFAHTPGPAIGIGTRIGI